MEYIVSVGRPEEMESLGAERLVRCKDCAKGHFIEREKHPKKGEVCCTNTLRNGGSWRHEPDWYCADAEQKGR